MCYCAKINYVKKKFLIFKKILISSLFFLLLLVCSCSKDTYTATFVDYDGSVIDSYELPKGSIPQFSNIPERESDSRFEYTFYSWDKSFEPINDDVTYKAIYTTTVKDEEDEINYGDFLKNLKIQGSNTLNNVNNLSLIHI